jgi:hypothetical protein
MLLQRKFVICMILLRKGSVVQNKLTEINVAVLWGEHRAVW